MDLEVWNNRYKWFFAKFAHDFILTYVNKIVASTGLQLIQAEAFLKAETHLIKPTSKTQTEAEFFNEAVENVIKKHKRKSS